MTRVISLDFAAALAAPFSCPQCGSGGLVAMDAGDRVNFFCVRCDSCWHVELGTASLADPLSCPCCAHRETCLLAERASAGDVRTRATQ